MDKKIGIIPFEKWMGKKNLGSSRIRCHWLLPYWDDAEIFGVGKNYDVVIYQKAYWNIHMEMFKGIKIFDICDPDWLHWQYNFIECIDLCDAVTTSNDELTKAISKFTDKPVVTIADRIDPTFFGGAKKIHSGDAKVVVWFGYQHNQSMIDSALSAIAKNKMDLIVIADKPYIMPSQWHKKIRLTNYPFDNETFVSDLLEGDIVINPQLSTAKWKYKSNNKTLHAWAVGLPMASNDKELKMFIPQRAREEEAEKRMQEIKDHWLVEKSVAEYKGLIESLQKNVK